MSGPVRVAYDALVAAHELKPDPAQSRAVAALDRLAGHQRSGGLLARLFGSGSDGPAGVYLWGGVGRGKSMLMDLAFEAVDIHPKRRVHFHEFMLETHGRLRVAREREEGDPIEPVAEQIAAEAKLLCFDEMQVTNPADACWNYGSGTPKGQGSGSTCRYPTRATFTIATTTRSFRACSPSTGKCDP